MTPRHRATKERKRIRRKRKAQHAARMEYWGRRRVPARLKQEAKDPNKVALALLELARWKEVAKDFIKSGKRDSNGRRVRTGRRRA